jgi:hypothetical protein
VCSWVGGRRNGSRGALGALTIASPTTGTFEWSRANWRDSAVKYPRVRYACKRARAEDDVWGNGLCVFLGRGSSKWVQGRPRGVHDSIPLDRHFGLVRGLLARLGGQKFQRKVRVLAC